MSAGNGFSHSQESKDVLKIAKDCERNAPDTDRAPKPMTPNVPKRLRPKTPTYRLISPVPIWRYYQLRPYGRVPLLLLASSSPTDDFVQPHPELPTHLFDA